MCTYVGIMCEKWSLEITKKCDQFKTIKAGPCELKVMNQPSRFH